MREGINHISLRARIEASKLGYTKKGIPALSGLCSFHEFDRNREGPVRIGHIKICTYGPSAARFFEETQEGDLIDLNGQLCTRSYEDKNGHIKFESYIEPRNWLVIERFE